MGNSDHLPLFVGLVSILSWKVYGIFTLFMILCVREGVTTAAETLCLRNQSLALLSFKQSVHFPVGPDKSISTWHDGTDCCRWGGVSCDRTTGFVTSLNLSYYQLEVSELDPASLLKLHRLRHLDLSYNIISGVIPSGLFELTSLTYLGLSDCQFYGSIPKSFKQLSNLKFLDLSRNLLSGEIPSGLLNHPTLQSLHLSGNMLSGPLPHFGSGLSVIREVRLGNNLLDGDIPSSISNLPRLEVLDLRKNEFSGTLFVSLFQNLKNLSSLGLSGNNLTVELPQVVDLDNEAVNVPHLETLLLRSCRINGEFPLFLQSAKRLIELDLGNNNISGKIPTWLWSLSNLEFLDLSHNMFIGLDERVNISAQAAVLFPRLEFLDLGYCNIKEFPWILPSAKRLTMLQLSHNNIIGKIPTWVWGLPNLHDLDLSYNMLHDFEEVANITGLVNLDLELRSKHNTVSASTLKFISLSNNNIRGAIPSALFCNMSALLHLDLSRNNLSSAIPDCITKLTNLWDLRLSSNQLQGKVPRGLICQPNLVALRLKGNHLTGKIARLFHNCSGDLQFLDLSYNSFTGSLPNNWLTRLDKLNLLDMSNNDLHGPIPKELITKSLRVLVLNNNKLTGMIPRYLSNCTLLEILNLGSNELSDMFPSWLGHLEYLHVLILHSNKLHGRIMSPGYAFSSLQILDISRNQFLGHLPYELFQNFYLMMWSGGPSKEQENKNDYVYGEEFHLHTKGQTQVWKLTTMLTSIDLSDNQFVGEIPEGIGALNFLYSLNLSRNNLHGPIPKSLGQLQEMESLDLSHNNLYGSIPEELTKDTFLSVLDLSYNNLQGRIPQSNQFSTFNAISFEGNPGLCGPPLVVSCPSNKRSFRVEGTVQDPNWEYLIAGIGVVVGVLTIVLPLMFIERFARWYWDYMDWVLEALIFLLHHWIYKWYDMF